jgi:hypothetical protein
MNIREKILQADDIETKEITVKKWGVKLLLTALTGEQRRKVYEDSTKDGVFIPDDFPYNLFIASVLDPVTKEPVFKTEDIEALRKKNGSIFESISKELMALSAIGEAAQEEAEKK